MKDSMQRYREARLKRDPDFAKGYEEGYQQFKLGVILKLARQQAGLTQAQVAKKLRTNKSAISRIERHAKDMRLSTLHNYAKALGKRVTLDLS